MTGDTIYAKLVTAGLSPIGACALMGNMQAESAMRANNAQDGMGSLTDAEYTERTDSGAYQAFVTDSIGYGLCQWTYAPRKRNLLEFARSRGVSIGDADMQVDFCLWELRNEYSHLLRYLYTATNLYEATGKICTEYERPAVNNISVRAAFANEFYCQFGGCDVSDIEGTLPPTPETTVPILGTTEDLSQPDGLPPRVLVAGDRGAAVSLLQALLVYYGYLPSLRDIDGDFGARTRLAVMGYQASAGMIGDGICSRETWLKLLGR